MYWPTPGFKGKTCQLCVLNQWTFNFCVRSSPLRGLLGKWWSCMTLILIPAFVCLSLLLSVFVTVCICLSVGLSLSFSRSRDSGQVRNYSFRFSRWHEDQTLKLRVTLCRFIQRFNNCNIHRMCSHGKRHEFIFYFLFIFKKRWHLRGIMLFAETHWQRFFLFLLFQVFFRNCDSKVTLKSSMQQTNSQRWTLKRQQHFHSPSAWGVSIWTD